MKQLSVGQSRRAAGLAVGVPGSVLVTGQRWPPFSEGSSVPSTKPCLAPCKASMDPSQQKQGSESLSHPQASAAGGGAVWFPVGPGSRVPSPDAWSLALRGGHGDRESHLCGRGPCGGDERFKA